MIYGAGGRSAARWARAFAREGAQLFLAGRTLAKVRVVADEIGAADAAQVDANDERAVERHFDGAVRNAGAIVILFNAIGMVDVRGPALVDMRVEDFLHPVMVAAKTQFHTARAAARHMAKRARA